MLPQISKYATLRGSAIFLSGLGRIPSKFHWMGTLILCIAPAATHPFGLVLCTLSIIGISAFDPHIRCPNLGQIESVSIELKQMVAK